MNVVIRHPRLRRRNVAPHPLAFQLYMDSLGHSRHRPVEGGAWSEDPVAGPQATAHPVASQLFLDGDNPLFPHPVEDEARPLGDQRGVPPSPQSAAGVPHSRHRVEGWFDALFAIAQRPCRITDGLFTCPDGEMRWSDWCSSCIANHALTRKYSSLQADSASLCGEAAPRATTAPDAAAAGGASKRFPAPVAGEERPPQPS